MPIYLILTNTLHIVCGIGYGVNVAIFLCVDNCLAVSLPIIYYEEMEEIKWIVVPIRFHQKQYAKLKSKKQSIAEIIRTLVDKLK